MMGTHVYSMNVMRSWMGAVYRDNGNDAQETWRNLQMGALPSLLPDLRQAENQLRIFMGQVRKVDQEAEKRRGKKIRSRARSKKLSKMSLRDKVRLLMEEEKAASDSITR